MFNFYPYEENRKKFEQRLTDSFPFIKKETIGKSLVNRDIEAFTLGNKNKRIIIAGGFHGSEHLTINVLYHFLWDLGCSFKNGTAVAGIKMKRYLQRRGVSVVPCVNPDGTEINIKGISSAKGYSHMVKRLFVSNQVWQSNARGVDINHNFPANWEIIRQREIKMGISSPSPTRYGGKSPASEPETKAITDYCIENCFQRGYALHSQGREIYYTFGKSTPKDSPAIARLLSSACGYKLSSPPEIADGGGFKDWFIEFFKKPAFTFEIGKGKNPLPLSDLDKEYRLLQKALCLTLIV